MSGTEMELVQGRVKEAVAALVKSDPLLRGSRALADVAGAALKIESEADGARLGDLRLSLRKAVRHVETALTDMFRPQDAFKKLLRESAKARFIDPMEGAVARIDSALLAWDSEKRRLAAEETERINRELAAAAAQAKAEADRLAEQAARLQREAEAASAAGNVEAAKTLADEAAALEAESDEPPPGLPQVIAPVVDRGPQRGDTATTFLRRTLECALEDRAGAMRAWPEAFTFSPAAACKAFDASGERRPADGEFVLAGGIRFTVVVSIGGRGR